MRHLSSLPTNSAWILSFIDLTIASLHCPQPASPLHTSTAYISDVLVTHSIVSPQRTHHIRLHVDPSLDFFFPIYPVHAVRREDICEGASRSYKTDEKEEGHDFGTMVNFVHRDIGA
jgi:hypothetical protein